jgi:hypothetical protein
MLAAATVLFAALTAAAGAGASVYKCQGGAGSGVVYQDEPCPPGRELRNFDADPPDLSVINGGFARAPAAAEKPPPAPPLERAATPGTASGSAKERKFIHAGMTEAEVLARIGRPDATSGGSKGRQTRWSYLPADDDPDTVTSITFAGGTVSEVSRKVIKR